MDLPDELLLYIALWCLPAEAMNLFLGCFDEETMLAELKKRKDCYLWNGVDKVPKDVKWVIIIPGVKSIDNWAFADCRSLTSVHIPDSVTTIGASAFRVCKALTSIHIPDSVTEINEYLQTHPTCLLYTSPSPRDRQKSRMPSSA